MLFTSVSSHDVDDLAVVAVVALKSSYVAIDKREADAWHMPSPHEPPCSSCAVTLE